tara:strand:+ start:705 stop:1250 length:546 start_codon:yes stop_codon:yes gene_type:complete
METTENNFEYHLRKVFELAEVMGVSDPLDKSKYREVITAEKLGHDLFFGASGGKHNDETYGADATDSEGTKVEYKSCKVTKTHYEKFLKGELNKKYSMVYNGAYSRENIDRYSNIRHILSLFYNEKLLMSIEVPTDHVLESLHEVLDAKNARREKGENVTTNCNSVTVTIRDSKPTIGNIL